MKLQQLAPKIVFVLALIAFIIGISAFSQKDKADRNSFRKERDSTGNDITTSRQRDRYLTDKDMDKIDAPMKRLDEQMDKLDESMQKIDKIKIERQINDAIKQVDVEKINQRIEETMNKIDIQKINSHLHESMARIDRSKLKSELDRIHLSIEKGIKNSGLHEVEVKAHIDNAMKHAKEAMQKAKEEIKNMKDFTDELQKDGLIDKKKNYKIEVKSGELYIDGRKQSKEVSDKYRKYYRKETFTININDEDGVRV